MENESQSNIDISDKDIWDAQCGDGKTMMKIGYELSMGTEENEEQALLWYEEAAKRHYVSDYFIRKYADKGGTANLEKAFVFCVNSYNTTYDTNLRHTARLINWHEEQSDDFWFDTAVKYNILDEFVNSLRLNYDKLTIERRKVWLTKAIDAGNINAMYVMACLSNGEERKHWLTEAALRDNQSAIDELVKYYYMRSDHQEVIYWGEKSKGTYTRSLVEKSKRELEELR
jgi:TPR repeat protein